MCVFTNKKATLALPRGTGHYTLKDFKALLGKSKYEQDKEMCIRDSTADAYFRGLLPCFVLCLAGDVLLGLANNHAGFFGRWFLPVSYTHLDVYKRQMFTVIHNILLW